MRLAEAVWQAEMVMRSLQDGQVCKQLHHEGLPTPSSGRSLRRTC